MSNSIKFKKRPKVILILGIFCIILLTILHVSTLVKIYPRFLFRNATSTSIFLHEYNEKKDLTVDGADNPLQIEEHNPDEVIDERRSNVTNFSIPDFPVDIVYTWVNGSDPVWEEKKNEAMKAQDIKIGKKAQAGRYIDIGELKYSLRCVEKFLPWVHKIYIITDNQFPNFLKKKQSKVEIINHSQIIPEQFLPTFNSNNIDFHLHLIPNLSEHFIYLNDDVFISRPLQKYNFFNSQGQPILPVAKYNWENQKKTLEKISLKHWLKNDMGSNQYNLITMHTVEVFSKKYNKTVQFKCRHGYIPLTITILNKMWDSFSKELAAVETHSFRAFNDLQMPTLLIQFGIGFNYISILHTSQAVRYLVMTGQFTNKLNKFNSSDYDSFCLNSGEKTSDRMRIAAKDFLQRSYPIKSSFEI